MRGNEDRFDVLDKHLLTLFYCYYYYYYNNNNYYYYYYYAQKQNKQTNKALVLLRWVSKNVHIIKCDILDWQ